ncbi:MAG: hypothetical protein AB1894_01135 [Chloroflexota bacterium]
MDEIAPRPLPERNPITHAKHKHEVLWQITVPLGVGVLVLVGLAIAMGFGSAEQHSRWADISLIWLISPMLIVALLFLVILAGLTYGLIVLIQILPPYARQVQDFFVLLSIQVGKLGDKLVDPVLRIRAFKASFQTLTRNLRWRL